MKKKQTIALIAITASTINSFMLRHIEVLSKDYNLLIFCNDTSLIRKKIPKNVLLTNINFKRQLNLIFDSVSFLFLLYFLVKYRPHLTISITPKAGLITAISSFIAGVSYRIHYFTGQTWVTKKGFVRFIYKISDRIIFKLSHHVLMDSSSQKKFLISNNIISHDRSTVLLHGSVGGVNTKKFKYKKTIRNLLRKKLQISKNDFTFLYLGRMNRDKGIIDLIKAFQKIKNSHNILLILVGPIEDEYIKNFIKKNKKVIYVGETLNPEKWFSMADILCLPSYREGFGSVVIEAGSCNLPTLGSNIYGITDAIVKNQTGFLHKVGSISDIKKKMLLVIKNRKLLKKYGQRARKRVEKKFEENLISEKFLEFIKSRIN
ncbi:glycosyltransferase [Candidatus Pelagibacter sp.]|nr:glycosyltransferase [Candidatus Pelagibacter sp.]MDC1483604.1 glycosyltransferase [Pelagibacteraceae bacterium]